MVNFIWTERQQLLIVHPHNITFYWLNEAQYGDFYTERQSMVNLLQYEHFYTDWTAYCKPIIIYLNTGWTTGYCIYINTDWTTAYCKPIIIYLNTEWTTCYCIYLNTDWKTGYCKNIVDFTLAEQYWAITLYSYCTLVCRNARQHAGHTLQRCDMTQTFCIANGLIN